MTQLTAGLQAAAIIRATQAAGGFAMVLAKGDDQGGGILLLCAERGQPTGLLERVLAADFAYAWQRVGPDEFRERDEYLARRRNRDPDLWVIELDIADAERFAAESFRFD